MGSAAVSAYLNCFLSLAASGYGSFSGLPPGNHGLQNVGDAVLAHVQDQRIEVGLQVAGKASKCSNTSSGLRRN